MRIDRSYEDVERTLDWCLKDCSPIVAAPMSHSLRDPNVREELTLGFVLRGRPASANERRRILDIAALEPTGGERFVFDLRFHSALRDTFGNAARVRQTDSHIVHRTIPDRRRAPHHFAIASGLSYLSTYVNETVINGASYGAHIGVTLAFQVLHPLNTYNARASRLFCASHTIWYWHLASIYSHVVLNADRFWSETFPQIQRGRD